MVCVRACVCVQSVVEAVNTVRNTVKIKSYCTAILHTWLGMVRIISQVSSYLDRPHGGATIQESWFSTEELRHRVCPTWPQLILSIFANRIYAVHRIVVVLFLKKKNSNDNNEVCSQQHRWSEFLGIGHGRIRTKQMKNYTRQ